jgi:hypothetical protein
MNAWRRTRNEMAGAWRSVRYDLGARRDQADEEPVGDVSTTGMDTFGGALPTGHPIAPASRPHRRMVAVGAFGALAVAGAAGSYFLLANGLGSLLAGKAAGAEAPPPAVAAPARAGSNAGLGQGTSRSGGGRPATAPATLLMVPGTVTVAPRPPAGSTAAGRTGRTPPVPTPTSPAPKPKSKPKKSPSPSPSPNATRETTPSDGWNLYPRDQGDWPDNDYPWGDEPHFPRFRPYRRN